MYRFSTVLILIDKLLHMSTFKEINYLPRFVSAHGDQLDNLIGNENIINRGYFVTLRFRKYIPSTDIYKNNIRLPITESAIQQNWESFFKIINKKVMKAHYRKRKHNKRIELPTLAVLEIHSTFTNLNHIHMIMLKPDNISGEDFQQTIKTTWSKTYWGTVGTENNPLFDSKKIYSRKVIPYIFTEKDFFIPHALHCTSKQRLCLFNSL